jgi:hypothetical protein
MEELSMRIFFIACIVAAVIAVIGAVALGTFQQSVAVAFSSSAVRL